MNYLPVSHDIRRGNLHVITFSVLLVCVGSNIACKEYYGTSVPPPVTAIPEADKLIKMSNIRSRIECFSLCMTYSECGMTIYSVSDKVCILRKIKQLPGASSFIDIPANSIYTLLQAPECSTSDGYIYQSELRLCYQIGSAKISWNEAADNCNKYRGRLIHIKNKEVMNYLKSILSWATTEYHEFHMGLCKDLSKKVFVWQDGEALTYSHWGPTEPSNHGGIEDCGSFNPYINYRWNDIGCHVLNSGTQICEIVVR
ncbi:macrophage mannose receptor 1-like [Octopus sinensis]|uniref:Macrophage mannose receptor 1-like n=1 Tax=Octopus sinensis TaxID=2607531 RepID=A0A7E6F347_9MOLL|nr:macrophage mannose receptor 1-like [Octopus sinensis]